MAIKKRRINKLILWSKHSVYTFPLVLIILLLLLTAFRINGSSVGTYHQILYGSKSNDPDLLYGQPRGIRSDEYLGGTPLAALQYRTDFPQFNKNLGSGRDLALLPDAPTKSWLTIFRPQNWSFFVLPFENAFAFRWWFGLFLLIISTYFFALRFLDKNKTLSILLSLSFGLSPFFLWWFQSSLFVPMALSFLMLILGMRIINQEKIPLIKSQTITNILYVLALSYVGAIFALFLYVPFLIPIFLVCAAFIFGYLINERFTNHSITTKGALKRLALLLSPLLIIAPILLLFTIENKQMIHAVSASEYPGHRVVHSGNSVFSPLFPIIGSFLVPLLQSSSRGAHYYTNQSEASNFILLLPFILIPGIFIQIIEYKKRKKINYTFLAIQLIALIFLLRISIHFGDKFYNLLLLDKVPHNRLLAGIGLAGFIQLIYFIKMLPALKLRGRMFNIMALSYGTFCLAVLLAFTIYVRHRYPIFAIDLYKLIIPAFAFAAILVSLFAKRFLLATSLLLIFTVISSYRINPVYQGVGIINDSKIIHAIDSNSKPSDSWAVVDNFTFEALPNAAGRKQISGTQIYSDIKFWRQLDTTGKYENIYNRQAHALFVSNTAPPNKYFRPAFATIHNDMELVKGNVFKVRFACNKFIYDNVNFVLVTHKLNFACTVPVDEVDYPNLNFYIYKVNPTAKPARLSSMIRS